MTSCDACELSFDPHHNRDGDTNDLCEPCTRLADGSHSIRMSPMTKDDLELVLAWRSNPKIYSHFRQQNGPLQWDEHVAWFDSRDADRYDFIIHFNGRRVGSVNISADREVGIFLGDFSAHGRGVGSAGLEWLCERFNDRTPLYAEIHESNTASVNLFEKCGFVRHARDGKWCRYTYDP